MSFTEMAYGESGILEDSLAKAERESDEPVGVKAPIWHGMQISIEEEQLWHTS